MKILIEFFLKRPLLVNLLTVIILVVGGYSLYNLQKETFPKVEFDIITIRTNYSGSSSEDVEKLITIPIERELKVVDGIKRMNAMSGEGFSIFTIEVEPDFDLDEVFTEVKDSVESTTDLPDEADLPVIKKINNKNRGTIKVALTGADYSQLKRVTKLLRDKLEAMRDVSRVNLSGYRRDEIRIEVDPEKLEKYHLTIGEIGKAIRQRNINLSAGYIESPKGNILIRTVAEFKNLDEIKNITVRSNPTGMGVKVIDVAEVVRVPEENAVIERSQAERAIFLDVLIRGNADVIKTTKAIKKRTDDFFGKDQFPQIKYRFTDDWSYYVTRRLNILSKSGVQGVFLVFAALLLFLNFSTSGVTALGAPLAFAASFIVMSIFGLSINLISMLALIMVLGMLVDDSIIVAEQYYQNVEAGYEKYEAAKKAALETIKPITATVLTSCIAFGSMFFMGGIMGKFLWPVPIIIIICLVASLLECFFILPSHLNDFAKVPKKHGDHDRWYTPVIKSYGKALRPFLKHPFMVSFFFIAIFIGSIFIAKSMRFELFPGDDVRLVFLQIKGEVGTPLEDSDAAIAKLEKMILKNLKSEELDQIRSKIGMSIDERSAKTGNHYGSIMIYLTPPDERERSTDEIINGLVKKSKSLVPKYLVTVLKRQGGPPKGKAVEVELTGDSLDDLKIISKKVQGLLNESKGVVTTEIDFEEGKRQIIAKVDNTEARRLGISTDLIAMELRKAFSGDSVTEIREADEDIPIRVYLDKKSRGDVKTLNKLFVFSPRGNRIPITKVVKFVERPGAFVIRRKDRKRIISVSASLDKKLATPQSIIKILDPKLKKLLNDYPAISYNFGGENEDTRESMAALTKAGIISFLCIFFVLVVMFNSLGQPIVIMSVIPMGLIGVILAFKIKGAVLSFMALLGVIGLIGVVVNDSIVLVNFINKKREELNNDLQAVIEACMGRFRPVILTSITTVAGLLPVAHAGLFGGSVGDPFVKPMAFAFAYGLAFATVITLIFVPANYLVYLKTLYFFKNLFSQNRDLEDDMDGGILESEI
ncbi:MAG: hypothetical protein DRQ89_07470 [Epsilonproteobacteria bacterium]|nr:MAG: hypothetical protein DRQ89_07470 [Campylobacterota bacterium]